MNIQRALQKKQIQKTQYASIMIGALIIIHFFLMGCGIIFNNQAFVEITNDETNDDTMFAGMTIYDVLVNGDRDQKSTVIRSGNSILFKITWWGENQYIAPISYYTKNTDDDVKNYIKTSIMVRNFDNLKIHLLWDTSKHRRIEKRE